jgi:sterol desaturase/sphingolipid hydroxylase (fatty acid hydroxylase superfamily)
VWPILYYVRSVAITLAATNVINFILSIIGLNLYNETHFFVIHRIMHLPFFMKHVHRIHHRSLVPALTSVYSFHPLEALLLSAVQLCLSWMVPLKPLAIMVYPVSSILLNFKDIDGIVVK